MAGTVFIKFSLIERDGQRTKRIYEVVVWLKKKETISLSTRNLLLSIDFLWATPSLSKFVQVPHENYVYYGKYSYHWHNGDSILIVDVWALIIVVFCSK